MKKRKVLLWRSFLALVCLFGTFFLSENVQAADKKVTLSRGKEVFYQDYSTFYYYIDGELGYCLEPKKSSPQSGNFSANILDNNKLLSKALYYVYGGPGYKKYMEDQYPDKWTTKAKAYCLSHCILSYIYDDCKDSSDAFKGLSSTMKKEVKECADYIKTLPDIPEPDISFSKTELEAYFDEEQNLQRTESILCQGHSGNTLTFELPEGIRLVNETKGTEEHGEITISGGDTFYLTADMDYKNVNPWESGELYGSDNQKWRSLVVSTGSGSQHLGMGELITVTVEPAFLKVTWLPGPQLDVTKTADIKSKIFQMGDIITYTLDVTQQIERAVAHNVVIKDYILTDGVKLVEDSIILSKENQIVSDAIITTEENTFTIQTNSFLKAEDLGGKFTVQYKVEIVDLSLVGKEIENEVCVYADNAEEEKDENVVEVEEPEEPEIPEEPEEPEKPETPEEPKEPEKPVEKEKVIPVKTGDRAQIALPAVLFFLSCVVISICGTMCAWRKTHRRK